MRESVYKMPTPPQISVIIVNYNGRDLLAQALESLWRTSGHLALDVWVVDNGSSDHSVELLSEEYPKVHWIRNSENLGFARANNQALVHAVGEYILLLNNDTIVHPAALETLLRIMNSHPELAACGPQLLNHDGTVQLSCIYFPSLSRLFLNYIRVRAGHGAKYVVESAEDVSYVDAASGACLLIRRTALEQVGLLDEGYFMYAEETDWCFRAKQMNWQIGYVPSAKVVHLGGQTSKHDSERFYVERRYSNVRFFLKHRGRLSARINSFLLRTNLWMRWLKARKQRDRYRSMLRVYDQRITALFNDLDATTTQKHIE